MITTGKRITVVNSSTSRKGAHIRRGSTGFIINTSNAYLCIIKNKTALIMPTFVTFNKFGFEKKQRCESKWVGIVLPLFDITGSTAMEEINSLLINTTKYNDHKKIMGNIKLSTFITIKMAPLNVLKDENEFSSWMVSVMHSNSFNMSLMHRCNTEFNKKLIKILSKVGIERPFNLQLLDKEKFLYKINLIFKGNRSHDVFNSIQTLLSLEDIARINIMKNKYTAPRLIIPAFMNKLLCTDAWCVALLNNSTVKFKGEELKLTKLVYSVNKVLSTL